jgi:hypothetical protein
MFYVDVKLFFQIKERTWTDNVQELGAEEDIWA